MINDFILNDPDYNDKVADRAEREEIKFMNMNHLCHNDDVVPQGDSTQSESPLKRPANHNLIEIFKELKFGRPAASQKYLDNCIKELEKQNVDI